MIKKSMGIAVNISFDVWFNQDGVIEKRKMSYMELGLFLVNNSLRIKKVEISLED